MLDYSDVLILMMIQGMLGGFDTLFYHEYVYNLPKYSNLARSELRLHALRDFIYAILYFTLPFFRWQGVFSYVLIALFLTEIVITLMDFATEDGVRQPWGGIAKGERSMHLIIGIIYGAFLAFFSFHILEWMNLPTGFAKHEMASNWQRIIFPILGFGTLLSGIRDWGAQLGISFFQFTLFPDSPVKVPKS